jgi:mannose-6-phosphate isomerase-like protein (cupin superfamily)
MILKIDKPSIIEAAGTKPKIIREFIGRVNSNTDEVSIARMTSPQGWTEPAQTPQFNEYTLVLKGTLQVKTKEAEYIIKENECIITGAGEWVQYSTPFEGGAEYVAICVPAFSPDTVQREE